MEPAAASASPARAHLGPTTGPDRPPNRTIETDPPWPSSADAAGASSEPAAGRRSPRIDVATRSAGASRRTAGHRRGAPPTTTLEPDERPRTTPPTRAAESAAGAPVQTASDRSTAARSTTTTSTGSTSARMRCVPARACSCGSSSTRRADRSPACTASLGDSARPAAGLRRARARWASGTRSAPRSPRTSSTPGGTADVVAGDLGPELLTPDAAARTPTAAPSSPRPGSPASTARAGSCGPSSQRSRRDRRRRPPRRCSRSSATASSSAATRPCRRASCCPLRRCPTRDGRRPGRGRRARPHAPDDLKPVRARTRDHRGPLTTCAPCPNRARAGTRRPLTTGQHRSTAARLADRLTRLSRTSIEADRADARDAARPDGASTDLRPAQPSAGPRLRDGPRR